MVRRAPHHSELEPAIMRLRLELHIGRHEAEACVRAGYTSAGLIAAAEDEEFHAAVVLPSSQRANVLARAREPRSKATDPGAAPTLARDHNPAGVVVRVTKPVLDTVSRIAGTPEAKPAESKGPKPAPPQREEHKRPVRRTSAGEVESDLDDRLGGG